MSVKVSIRDDGRLYERVALRLQNLIERDTFGAGDRLPSVRELSRDWSISVSTASAAYRMLEHRGFIETRPQSGHYVRSRWEAGSTRARFEQPRPPAPVTLNTCLDRLLADSSRADLLQLGAVRPSEPLLPVERLARVAAQVARRQMSRAVDYEFGVGNKALRAEVAQRSILSGCAIGPDEIVVTNGCMEALGLCLRAVCKPGDTVAVESPTYFGVLQVLCALGMKVVEVPMDDEGGLSLEALTYVLDQHAVKAVVLVPTFHNPTGITLAAPRRKRVVALLEERGIPLIEDDVYGETSFTGERPPALKSFDRMGNVLLCSSLSKTLAPGLRIGWVAADEKWREAVLRQKQLTNWATATLPQLVAAEFLANGGYEHHLRRMQRQLAQRLRWLADFVERHFPPGTELIRPGGGLCLWVGLPAPVDPVGLYEEACTAGMTVAPGPLFTTLQKFRNRIRLNTTFVDPSREGEIAKLGRVVRGLLERG